ncbi:uncharacterized protein LOC106177315 isoform X2 [Lingula anatina]|uniref:Uncharacterized protein LOC106177315 isoform X2 n=1 Tax=Lingula anatina TaxID=7574 RepID=A0A1S3JYL0_LINAN|nr:uncharacterized protein LOC106177315 isoform X2 [Lingula anatina]|eukprot:XP_013415510.1 uncharacterized protein LOC106177315 isoform X2 [Lingula anatina]
MAPVAVASSTDTLTCTGGEGLHSTGVLVGAVVAAVVITFGVAVALFVLYHRSMVHRFRKNRQSGDTVEVDAMESNNEYAVLDRKEVISKPDHTYAALQGRMTSFNTPPRK